MTDDPAIVIIAGAIAFAAIASITRSQLKIRRREKPRDQGAGNHPTCPHDTPVIFDCAKCNAKARRRHQPRAKTYDEFKRDHRL